MAMVERAIGTIRRECLAHVMIVGQVHLRPSWLATWNTVTPHEHISGSPRGSQAHREIRHHNRCPGARRITSPLCSLSESDRTISPGKTLFYVWCPGSKSDLANTECANAEEAQIRL